MAVAMRRERRVVIAMMADPRKFGRRLHCRRAVHRDGSATIEVAFCTPILFLVTLLFIELTNGIFLQQTLKQASYEGIRVAAKQGTDLADVSDICASILDARDVVSYEVTVDPVDFTNAPRGTLLTVTIDVNRTDNRLFGLLVGDYEDMQIHSYGLKE